MVCATKRKELFSLATDKHIVDSHYQYSKIRNSKHSLKIHSYAYAQNNNNNNKIDVNFFTATVQQQKKKKSKAFVNNSL